jgi:YVTN family beta-propeller protein
MQDGAAKLARVIPFVMACVGAACGEASAAAPLLYVTNQGEASVLVIDTGNDARVATLSVAAGPAMITAAPNGKHLFITHPEQGKITILDRQSLSAPRVLDISGTPFGIAASGDGRLYVQDRGQWPESPHW